MAYISWWFYFLVIALIVAYYVFPLRYRWITLLGANMAFYMAVSWLAVRWKFVFVLGVLILMSFAAWLFAQLIERNTRHKKVYLIFALCFDIAPLLFFKQLPFVMVSIMHRSLPTWWLAPIGISFYALQLIAYDVDVYRGTASAQKNYFKFLLFASFFPQIIQGPIPRYNQLSHQLVDGNRFDEEKFVRGFQLILWGFFLKLCIADKAGVVVDTVFDNCQTYRGGVRLNCRNTL